MKLAILVTVAFMAAYLTVTNATPFSGCYKSFQSYRHECILIKLYTHTAPYRPLGKGRFPGHFSSRAQLQDTSTTCTIDIYVTCSAELDRCTDNCASVDSQACSSCLGANYAECSGCYHEKEELEALGMLIVLLSYYKLLIRARLIIIRLGVSVIIQYNIIILLYLYHFFKKFEITCININLN